MIHEPAEEPDKPVRPSVGQFVEPWSAALTNWTPALAKGALCEAQTGNLRLAADLAEILLLDARIKQAFGKRTTNVLSADLEFDPGTGRRKGRAVRALEAGEDWWYTFPEDELALWFAWGHILGVGLAELVWRQPEGHGGRDVAELKIWHPRWLSWDHYRQVWQLDVQGGGCIDITPGDGKWMLFTPYGRHRPWMHGLWWPLVPSFLLKQFAYADWASHNKVMGSPQFVGKAPQNTAGVSLDTFRDSLLSMISKSAIVLPYGWEVELLQAKQGTAETFLKAIDVADRGIDIAILGNNLTTEVSAGSLAAAQVHRDGESRHAESDAKVLSGTIHDQYLTHWARFNFGTDDVAPWPHWRTEPAEDMASAATTLGSLGDAMSKLDVALAGFGLEVNALELVERFSVPVRPRTQEAPEAPPGTNTDDKENETTGAGRAGGDAGDDPPGDPA